MTAQNVRGLLYTILIGALMAAGVMLATTSRADTQQDYTYITSVAVYCPQYAPTESELA